MSLAPKQAGVNGDSRNLDTSRKNYRQHSKFQLWAPIGVLLDRKHWRTTITAESASQAMVKAFNHGQRQLNSTPAWRETQDRVAVPQRAFRLLQTASPRSSAVIPNSGQLRSLPRMSAVGLPPLARTARTATCTRRPHLRKDPQGSGPRQGAIFETCCTTPQRISHPFHQPQKPAWHRWCTAKKAANARCPIEVPLKSILNLLRVHDRVNRGPKMSSSSLPTHHRVAAHGGKRPPARLRNADRIRTSAQGRRLRGAAAGVLRVDASHDPPRRY